jgi:hypothetical protein
MTEYLLSKYKTEPQSLVYMEKAKLCENNNYIISNLTPAQFFYLPLAPNWEEPSIYLLDYYQSSFHTHVGNFLEAYETLELEAKELCAKGEITDSEFCKNLLKK